MTEDIPFSILHGMRFGIVACDLKGSVLFSNAEADELLGLGGGPVSPEAWRPFIAALGVKQGTRTRAPRFELVSLPHDNTKLMVLSSPMKARGKVTGAVYIFCPLERFEKNILGEMDSYRKVAIDFEAIIESTYDGIYITDGHANTLMVNRAYERITGIRRSEVLGRNMKQLVASGVIDRSVSLEVIAKKKPVTILQELRSGKKILVTGSPVIDKKTNQITVVVTNARDITELIELRDQLHERTLEANRYLAELDKLKTLEQQQSKFLAKSKKICEVLEIAVKAAQFDSNILITGESGVGKGLMARLIHESSDRKDHPFMVINCAGIPEDLFESELFGYEAGAFSGASTKGKKGLLEVADKGTVFLDEIGDMSLRLQAKLLRVIEEKEMVRLGSTKTIKLNVRITAATNQDIPSLIQAKRFRQDLFFRLNGIPIAIPPLRERVEDMVPLIRHFAEKLNHKYGINKTFSTRALQVLMTYPFPGNVRELSNIVEQSFLISKHDVIEADELPVQVRDLAQPQGFDMAGNDSSLSEIINLMEYKVLKSAMEKYGSTHKVAKRLKISQSTIVRKMKKLGIKSYDTGSDRNG